MYCKVCKNKMLSFGKAKIMQKYNISYFKCETCGFICTEDPYWLEEAYQKSINITDTGILSRNLYLSKITSQIIKLFFNNKKKYIDYAGGYGIFTRLMRDKGIDFFWKDPYSENLVARGFEASENCSYELLTAFEVLEHMENPLTGISQMLGYSDNILLSTYLVKSENVFDESWWYYGLEHGQHISFYTKKTLEYICKIYNLHLYTNNINMHLMSKRKINAFILKGLFLFYRLRSYATLISKNKSKTNSDMQLLIDKIKIS